MSIIDNKIRVNIDDKNEKFEQEVRESQTKKIPLTLIIGDNEVIMHMVKQKQLFVQLISLAVN